MNIGFREIGIELEKVYAKMAYGLLRDLENRLHRLSNHKIVIKTYSKQSAS